MCWIVYYNISIMLEVFVNHNWCMLCRICAVTYEFSYNKQLIMNKCERNVLPAGGVLKKESKQASFDEITAVRLHHMRVVMCVRREWIVCDTLYYLLDSYHHIILWHSSERALCLLRNQFYKWHITLEFC